MAASRRGITYDALLFTLGVVFLASPFIRDFNLGGWVSHVLLSIVLIAAIQPSLGSRPRLVAALILGVPAILGRLASVPEVELPNTYTGSVFVSNALFLSYVVYHIMKDVMAGERVSGDKLKGAICVFLLLGLTWSLVYGFIEFLEPGSFAMPAEMATSADARIGGLYYYSFVTLTTLGFGDITPVGEYARTFSWIEAVVGQLFIAIMIARLVGLHAAQKSESE